jgi:molybdopterin-dependent oxidoreductase alpha subunit
VAKKLRHRRHWVGPVPYGIGEVKPNHYKEMAHAIWENRRHPLFAWRILRDGVCDGCALGTTGMRDFTMKGVHLCTVRLNLLPLNTMDALDPVLLHDAARLEPMDSKSLRALGRLPYPMLRRAGEQGFTRISWDAALDVAAKALRETDPHRMGFYLTSRGITNEVYYAAQKAARFVGTNNVDNSARLCHAPSTVAMKAALGAGASTVSYKDWIGAGLIVFIGSHVANNQPVTMKYLVYAKRAGTKVAVVNPHREPALERYWVPSVAESALLGTKITDEFFGVHTGGDLAFLNGVFKHLIERDWVDHDFIAGRTSGFDDARAVVEAQTWDLLETASGASRDDMLRFAALLRDHPDTIFVWSMGVTQHAHGTQTVRAIVNLALARGAVGREHAGLMPIRGHSGVQGGAEVGCVPNVFPGNRPVNAENAATMKEWWGFDVPSWPGMDCPAQMDAAVHGDLDLLWSAGGNFLETLPEPALIRRGLANIAHRIHQDIVLTSQMLVPPKEWALLLPARTRYEQSGGGTETTTERQIIFSPRIRGPVPGEARSEWEIFTQAAARAFPDRAGKILFAGGAAIRADIARTTPLYSGIEKLRRKRDHVQWGGRILFRGGAFATADGRAAFRASPVPESTLRDGEFLLSTRRGKQFNSMVHRAVDPLTGAGRDDVFVSSPDATTLNLKDGQRVRLESDAGAMQARVKIAPMRPGNVQVHWPEGQGLMRRGTRDPECGIPDYNAVVRITPA